MHVLREPRAPRGQGWSESPPRCSSPSKAGPEGPGKLTEWVVGGHPFYSTSVCSTRPPLSAGLGSSASKAEAASLPLAAPSPRLQPTPSRRGSEVRGRGRPTGTSALGASRRSKAAVCGDSLLLWREKRGCQPPWLSQAQLSASEPEAREAGGRGCKKCKYNCSCGHHTPPCNPSWFSQPLEGRLYPLCGPGSRS